MSNHSTDELVRLAKENHSDAIAEIVNRHKGMVFNLAYRILGNYHDAEEASQDAFIKAIQGIHEFRGNCQFSSWLYKICYNTCITYKRKKVITTPIEMSIGQSKHQYEKPVYLNEHTDRKIFINKALNSLPTDEATIVTLFYINEMPTSEIADVVGITEANVRVKLHRSRKLLREKLEFLLKHEAANL